ncbi:MAG TPA: HAMP domain-containing sensor histidine kinase [Terriglobia bacterium]|nr:HAMP domain-containing sensor histidine kinase [Terriglobia bacterium]
MNSARSFRSRLIWGTLLGLIGVLALAYLFALHAFRSPTNFIFWHSILFGSLALAFVLGGLLQIRKGLSEFNELRARLLEVREGKKNQIEGSYPAEVQPLVNDLNALLEHREQAVGRAQAKAGDLAHGLKTPLAVLLQESERAKASGEHELAASIAQQVERMQRQVNYHLAHARAAASGTALGASCAVAASAEGVVRTLLRLHAGGRITIESNIGGDHAVRAQREDVEEMLGNLLDNACKWAKSRVSIITSIENLNIAITVDDDGLGLDPAKRDVVLKRGVRADEAAPGSGLGLAIVRDLAELYGGTIALDSSPLGGLRARLLLPKA